MKKNNFGISLISLIITIIVIIILAAIVIFTGLGTPDQANFAKFASEFSDFNLAVDNAYMKEFEDNALSNQTRSKAQVYYKIATGDDVGIDGVPEAAGLVEELGGTFPEELKGNEYYLITSDKNVYNWKKEKQYFEKDEAHYVTDEGEAFFLPGYLVMENDGTEKWYVNERKYYIGDKKEGNPNAISSAEQERLDDEGIVVLTDEEINALPNDDSDTLPNADDLKSNNVKMVLQGEVGLVPVPKGFQYLEGTEQTGLVIKDAKQNEFVWIPVTNPSSMYYESETPVYLEEGVVTTTTKRWGKGSIKSMAAITSTVYREPDILNNSEIDLKVEVLNLAGFNNVQDFADDLSNEFNSMLESVIKYKGFYVGRYELGLDGTSVVCQPDKLVLTAAASSGTDESYGDYGGTMETQTWYGLYKACKGFSAGGVKSGMIWGCQWDAMVSFIGDYTAVKAGYYLTGQNPNKDDEKKNVHDTSSNLMEWTMTGSNTPYGANARSVRGGRFDFAFPVSSRMDISAIAIEKGVGSRPQLYIK